MSQLPDAPCTLRHNLLRAMLYAAALGNHRSMSSSLVPYKTVSHLRGLDGRWQPSSKPGPGSTHAER